jgi:hypothetical protein
MQILRFFNTAFQNTTFQVQMRVMLGYDFTTLSITKEGWTKKTLCFIPSFKTLHQLFENLLRAHIDTRDNVSLYFFVLKRGNFAEI